MGTYIKKWNLETRGNPHSYGHLTIDKCAMEKEQSCQLMVLVLGELGVHIQKSEFGTLPHVTHEN